MKNNNLQSIELEFSKIVTKIETYAFSPADFSKMDLNQYVNSPEFQEFWHGRSRCVPGI